MSDATASEARFVPQRIAPALGALAAGLLAGRGPLRLAVDIALVVILAFFCARLFWVVVGAPPSLPPDAISAGARGNAPELGRRAGAQVLTEFDPFHRARGAPAAALSAAEAETAPETGLDLVLFGVRATDEPSRATATIATPDGRQRVYAVGDEIIAGVTLARVYPDRVILRRNGAPESLTFRSAGVGLAPRSAEGDGRLLSAPPRPAVPAVATAAITQAQALALQSAADFRLQREGEAIVGIEILARGDPAPLAAAGFAHGDVIVALDGQPLRDAGALAARLRSAEGDMRVTVRRDGAERIITLRIAG